MAAVLVAQALRAPSGEGERAPQTLEDAEQENKRLRPEVISLRERESVPKNRWASSPKRPRAVCPDRNDDGRAPDPWAVSRA